MILQVEPYRELIYWSPRQIPELSWRSSKARLRCRCASSRLIGLCGV